MGGLNIGGMAAAFQGYQDEQRRLADDERRAKADQRQDQEAAFQEEARNRQRRDWSRQDKNQAADDADIAELNAGLQQGAAASAEALIPPVAGVPKSTGTRLPAEVASVRKLDAAMSDDDAAAASPAENLNGDAQSNAASRIAATQPLGAASTNRSALIPAATGIPQPRNFNHVLDMQQELLNRRLARGTLSAQDYANAVSTLGKMKTEGIHQALDLMAQGDYQSGIDAYNAIGQMRGARVVDGKEGVTQINGQDTPTHFVTVENRDGTRTTMDVAKVRYQLLDIDRQLQHQDAAAKNQMQRDQHQDQIDLGYAKLENDNQAQAISNNLQAQHLALAAQQFNASTPLGMIAAREKALGRSLTDDQKTTLLGIDAMPQATKLQVNSILKEQDQLSQAMNKAMADGTWQNASKDGVTNPLLTRQAMLNLQMKNLLSNPANTAPSGAAQNMNRLGLTPEGASAANAATISPAAQPAKRLSASSGPVLPPVGGIPAKDQGAGVKSSGMSDAQAAAWINDKLMGTLDGPNKYLDIAQNARDPQIKRVAASLYQQYMQTQRNAPEDNPAIAW